MEENIEDIRKNYTSEGKRIITTITIDNGTYYIDENKVIYEKIGNVYIEIQNERIIEKVKEVLTKPSDDFYVD